MKTKNRKILSAVVSFTILALPVLAYGAGLVPCGQPANTPDIMVGGASYSTTHPCGFNDLIVLANTIIHFLMYDVAVPLAALGIMYAGGRLVIMPSKESEIEKAKESFSNIIMGFLIMLSAYLVIKLIIYSFLNTDAGFYTFLAN